ncbi:hypothetical protein DJ535_13235 [Citrobacter murliniae]|uniref:Secreted protein n=1 Tax=Citrobacter murliniae TaxID=67829 RepID=A0ABY2PTU3_9ENTR|nr:hypothetical protein DJ535_13235 [Citrobacter murliniae]
MVITGAIAVIFFSLNRHTVNVNAAHYTRQRQRSLSLCEKYRVIEAECRINGQSGMSESVRMCRTRWCGDQIRQAY